MKFPVEGDVFLFQQPPHCVHSLVEPGPALVHGPVEALEFVGQEGPSEPAVQAAVGDRVQHADLAGYLQRVVEDRQHGAGEQPRLAGALGGRGEEDMGRRAVTAVGFEVMLNRADLGEAEFVAEAGQVQAFVPILLPRFFFGADVGEEL